MNRLILQFQQPHRDTSAEQLQAEQLLPIEKEINKSLVSIEKKYFIE